MTARDDVLTVLRVAARAGLGDVRTPTELLDAYTDQVLTEDGQAYPGELAKLRGLIRTLRVVVREDDNTAEVRRLLHEHAGDDATARKDTTAAAAPATPDLHQTILDAVRGFQIDRRQRGGYHQQLATHITQALAPLLPYREVWDPELPPGGYVCNLCGQPAESEPCPDHAPNFFQPGHTYTRQTHGDTAEFQVRNVEPHPDGSHQRAFGWYRRQPATDWHAYSQDNTDWATGDWTDTTTPKDRP